MILATQMAIRWLQSPRTVKRSNASGWGFLAAVRHHLSGGVESKKPETVEASQTRRTDRKRLFDSGGKIGDAALSAEMRGTRLWQL